MSPRFDALTGQTTEMKRMETNGTEGTEATAETEGTEGTEETEETEGTKETEGTEGTKESGAEEVEGGEVEVRRRRLGGGLGVEDEGGAKDADAVRRGGG